MQVSYNWLKEYVDIDLSAEKLAEVMTRAGVAVEHVIPFNKGVTGVIAALVLVITSASFSADRSMSTYSFNQL